MTKYLVIKNNLFISWQIVQFKAEKWLVETKIVVFVMTKWHKINVIWKRVEKMIEDQLFVWSPVENMYKAPTKYVTAS